MFSLRKWYLDCVADDGTTWIGYCGVVRWGPLRIPFSSSLVFDGTARARTRLSARMPRVEADRLSWNGAELVRRCEAVDRSLSESVRWRCVMPLAEVVVRHDGRTIRGMGYAEVLEISAVAPMTTLRWGRLTSTRTSLVWIQWRGASPLDLAIHNGHPIEVESIDDDELRLADGMRIALTERATIRRDAIARTIGPLQWLVPHHLTAGVEEKWRSRGEVNINGQSVDRGWVIHERVTFAAD